MTSNGSAVIENRYNGENETDRQILAPNALESSQEFSKSQEWEEYGGVGILDRILWWCVALWGTVKSDMKRD